MGDMRILIEELELGIPFESAAILAGFEFEEIEVLEKDDKVNEIIAKSNASLMHDHLQNIKNHSEVNPRMSTWLLERLFPEHFSQTNKIIEPSKMPKSVTLRGVGPSGN